MKLFFAIVSKFFFWNSNFYYYWAKWHITCKKCEKISKTKQDPSIRKCLPLDVWIRRWTDFFAEFSFFTTTRFCFECQIHAKKVEYCWNIWPVIFVCPSVFDHIICLYLTYEKNLALNGLYWIILYLLWGHVIPISYSQWLNWMARVFTNY